MASESLARSSMGPRTADLGRTRLVDRSALDQLIIGVLILFLLVYVSELMILVPCGSFAELSACDLPAASKAFWSAYFLIDPLFAQMPPYYVAIMSLQDYLYNPWWAVCLFMFWTNRQETPWLATITLLVAGMITATSSVILGVQLQHPHYTPTVMAALLMINGPWIAAPLLFSWRLRHRREPGAAPARRSAGAGRTLVLLALPLVAYSLLCLAATAIT